MPSNSLSLTSWIQPKLGEEFQTIMASKHFLYSPFWFACEAHFCPVGAHSLVGRGQDGCVKSSHPKPCTYAWGEYGGLGGRRAEASGEGWSTLSWHGQGQASGGRGSPEPEKAFEGQGTSPHMGLLLQGRGEVGFDPVCNGEPTRGLAVCCPHRSASPLPSQVLTMPSS